MKQSIGYGVRNIALIAFPGVAALDLTGPMEAFAAANDAAEQQGKRAPYRLRVLGVPGTRVTAESGLRLLADAPFPSALREVRAFDTWIVPGGSGLRVPNTLACVAQAMRRVDVHARRVASVCTGIYALAEAGLLNGRQVTTHWRFVGEVSAQFPKLVMHPDAIYLRDGKYYTSAGVTAGIDLALALIESDLGPNIALQVARELVVFLRRPGGQTQFSAALQRPIALNEPLAALAAFVQERMTEELSVERLAHECHLSPRQFTRRFVEAFGVAPGLYVKRVRVNSARGLLLDTRASIEQISSAVGFRSSDVFRRAFESELGVTPTEYRARFAADR